jgi:hemolysin activation/secretion protein
LPNQPDLRIESKDSAALPASAPFLVKEIRIVGNTAFDTATLHALVADQQGKTLTLVELGALAARISTYYQQRGYPLARAIIPAQTIAEVVVIQVVEARYGSVNFSNGSRVNTGLLESILSPLQKGQPVSETELDRAPLLLSDARGGGECCTQAGRSGRHFRSRCRCHAQGGRCGQHLDRQLWQSLHRQGPRQRYGQFVQPASSR